MAEKVRIGYTGHQPRNHEIGMFDLVGESDAEVVHECLRRIIDQLVGARHVVGDRTDHENTAPLAHHHARPDVVDQLDGALYLGVNYIGDVLPMLEEECVA